MDPVTAAILISLVAAGASAYVARDQQKKQQAIADDQQKEQEKMRIEQVRAEFGATQQKTDTALGGASNRKNSTMAPSFASAALTGNQSSNTSANAGSSGTF